MLTHCNPSLSVSEARLRPHCPRPSWRDSPQTLPSHLSEGPGSRFTGFRVGMGKVEVICCLLGHKINMFNDPAKELGNISLLPDINHRSAQSDTSSGNPQILVSVPRQFSHPDGSPPRKAQRYEMALQRL